MLTAAREVIALLPTAEVGRCVLAADGTLFTGDAAALRLASVEDALVFHPGRIRGALPQPKIAG